MEGREDFGTRLKELRLAKRLTQQALADGAGVSKALIEKMEAGSSIDPHLSTVLALCRALGVGVQKLAKL